MKESKPVSEMNEVELYFMIDGIGGFIWRMNHDMGCGRIPQKDCAAIDKDIEKMRVVQMDALRELSRFGITALDGDGNATPEYWIWYRTWSSWHKDTLTHEEWLDLDKRIHRGLTEQEAAQCKRHAFER